MFFNDEFVIMNLYIEAQSKVLITVLHHWLCFRALYASYTGCSFASSGGRHVGCSCILRRCLTLRSLSVPYGLKEV